LQKAAPAAGDEGDGRAGVVINIVPEFHYAKHGDLNTTLSNTDLKSSSGDSSTGSLLFTASKEITETFSLGLFYQLIYMDYSGGMFVPVDPPGLDGRTEVKGTAHVLGLTSDVNLQQYGKLNLSLLQDFETYNGDETMIGNPDNPLDTRSLDDFKVRVTSLMGWYELPCSLNESWTVTPYAGWRSVYAVASNQNDFSPGGTTKDSHQWVHLVSGGLTFDYRQGPLGLNFRAGVNHRVSSDDVPGLTSRAVSPSTVHLGYNTYMDRTMATYGVGLNYAINPNMVVAVGYDGAAGADVTLHKGYLALVFPF
jgi:hypothetical protein